MKKLDMVKEIEDVLYGEFGADVHAFCEEYGDGDYTEIGYKVDPEGSVYINQTPNISTIDVGVICVQTTNIEYKGINYALDVITKCTFSEYYKARDHSLEEIQALSDDEISSDIAASGQYPEEDRLDQEITIKLK